MRARLSISTPILTIALLVGLSARLVQAGIPVIDTANIAQSTISAVEETAQTVGQGLIISKQAAQYTKQLQQYAKQLEQYNKQLQQYENMLLNTALPEVFIWDESESTIEGLVDSIDTLSHYQGSMGSLDAYLGHFRDLAYYESSPCFSGEECTESDMEEMKENKELASESRKKANDALIKALKKQQEHLRADATKLKQLQIATQNAKGRLQALQYSNQLSSQQANQLLLIRALLIAEQNASVTEKQARNNLVAQEQASSARLRKGGFAASPFRTW